MKSNLRIRGIACLLSRWVPPMARLAKIFAMMLDYYLPASSLFNFQIITGTLSTGAGIGTSGNQEAVLHVKADRKIHKVSFDDILYIESLDEYVKLHLKDKVIVTRENISILEKKLSGNFFVRIHRSFIVSTKMITSVSAHGVDIAKKFLPFGRAFKQGALAKLGIPGR